MEERDIEMKKVTYRSKRDHMGGQHTNGPDYSIVASHPEYGISITVEEFRSQALNRELADLLMLVALAYIKRS